MPACPMSPDVPQGDDPFRRARESEGVLPTEFQGRPVPMILTHASVKSAARDWGTFSSDAPFRVPIPSEEDLRPMRQLPIETDPPEHGDYRRIVDPFFSRPKNPEMIAAVEALVAKQLAEALGRDEVEVVTGFALPLQCRALAVLLDVDPAEAEEWLGWGIHVFREGDGQSKGRTLDRYIHRRLDEALASPGRDFFSALTRAQFRGRPLTREEQAGFVNLTFAGGRDTVIQTVAGIIAHLAENPETLAQLRADPGLVNLATEEFFRYLSPLTHLGRVCPHATEVGGIPVEADERVSLVWASANRDGTVFDEPDVFRIDRKPNPHLAFGSGPHTCVGALHARLLVRTLLRTIPAAVDRIEILEKVSHWEHEKHYSRRVGFDRLRAGFRRRE